MPYFLFSPTPPPPPPLPGDHIFWRAYCSRISEQHLPNGVLGTRLNENYKNDDARAPFPALRQITTYFRWGAFGARGDGYSKRPRRRYMPDTKRTRQLFLNYVNAFTMAPRDQGTIVAEAPCRIAPPAFLIEVYLIMLLAGSAGIDQIKPKNRRL